MDVSERKRAFTLADAIPAAAARMRSGTSSPAEGADAQRSALDALADALGAAADELGQAEHDAAMQLVREADTLADAAAEVYALSRRV